MLRFARKVTVAPSTMTAEDVESLRAVEFSDLDVLHITEVAAYYAYANRIVDALGVVLEPWIPSEE